jgi:osmoprotectant transport system substrate-binding protein
LDRTILLPALAAALAISCAKPQAPLRVGSKNFTEQLILGEIVSRHLESRLPGVPIERRLNLSGTMFAHMAMQGGDIDLYPEYSGTALTTILKIEPIAEPSVVLERVRQEYRLRMRCEWLDPLGFDNSFAMVIRNEDAAARQVRTLSQAAENGEWRLGVGYEFQTREDGLPALNRAYKPHWKGAPQSMDLGLMFQALSQRSVDMIAANRTDGLLNQGGFQVLEDDKQAFPPYQAALVVRLDSLERVPGLRAVLSELSGKIDEATMRRLNFEVDSKKRTPGEVAAEWLKAAGLVTGS